MQERGSKVGVGEAFTMAKAVTKTRLRSMISVVIGGFSSGW
jgi:hypothetical protein